MVKEVCWVRWAKFHYAIAMKSIRKVVAKSIKDLISPSRKQNLKFTKIALSKFPDLHYIK